MNDVKIIKGSNDKVFKSIFGSEKGKELLRILLKDILGRDINNIIFLNKELPVKKANEKVKTLDLLIDNEEERMDIEVNSYFDDIIIFRNMLYFFGIIIQDQDSGDEYKVDKKYTLVNFTKGLDKSLDIINKVDIIIKSKKYYKNIEMYEVNLDKAVKLCYDGDERDYVRHIGALAMTRDELKKVKGDDFFMNEIDKALEILKADGCVVEDDTAKILKTIKSVNYAKGEKQGIEIGEKRGEERAILAIIKKMLQSGMNMKNIISITNTDEATVKKVAKELAN